MKSINRHLFSAVFLFGIFSVFGGLHAEVRGGSYTIKRTQTQTEFRDIELKAEVYDVEERWQKELYTWTEYDCDYVPGDGKGDWHGFYEAPMSQKPNALAAAIKGIGATRAELIVYSRNDYFKRKPRSWNEFKNEIWRIENDSNEEALRGVYNDVVIRYGDENRANLGYEYSGGYNFWESPDAFAGNPDPWHGYFNAKKADKPAALAKAIRGVGQNTAEIIVENGYFSSKPRSWDDFKAEIKGIERDLEGRYPAMNGLYENVVSRYGSDNKQNLYGTPQRDDGDRDPGDHYPSPGSGRRRQEPTSPQIVCRPVTRSETIWVKKTYEKLVDVLRKKVDVFIENGTLLNGETESIQLVWDGRSDAVQVNVSQALNSYNVSIEARGFVYKLTGTGRKAVSPASGDFSATLSNVGGKLTLTVNDSRAEELIGLSNGAYALVVNFKLVKKGGGCSSDKVMVTKSQTLSSGSGSIDLNSLATETLESKAKYQIKDLSFERQNTSFFSGRSGETKTSAVTYE